MCFENQRDWDWELQRPLVAEGKRANVLQNIQWGKYLIPC